MLLLNLKRSGLTPSIFLYKQIRAEDYYQLIGGPEGANDDIFEQSTLYTVV